MPSWRELVRNGARPLVDPVWHRVWGRIEARLAPIEARLSELAAPRAGEPVEVTVGTQSWDRLAPSFLNAVSTVEAFAHELRATRAEVSDLRQRLDRAEGAHEVMRGELSEQGSRAPDLTAVWDRIEFVRRELMFEQRYGRGGAMSPPAGGSSAPAARVVDTTKLEAMRASPAGIRLNLGCGHIPLEGYLNVDQRDLPRVDVIAAVHDLPFAPNTVAEISSAHLLEHFPEEMLRRNLLPYWHSLLRPGGRIRAVVPDGQAMLSKVASGDMSFADFREVLFGAQDYEGDFHYDMFTPASLTTLLQEAGFRDVAVPVAGRRNGKCYEFEITGQRP